MGIEDLNRFIKRSPDAVGGVPRNERAFIEQIEAGLAALENNLNAEISKNPDFDLDSHYTNLGRISKSYRQYLGLLRGQVLSIQDEETKQGYLKAIDSILDAKEKKLIEQFEKSDVGENYSDIKTIVDNTIAAKPAVIDDSYRSLVDMASEAISDFERELASESDISIKDRAFRLIEEMRERLKKSLVAKVEAKSSTEIKIQTLYEILREKHVQGLPEYDDFLKLDIDKAYNIWWDAITKLIITVCNKESTDKKLNAKIFKKLNLFSDNTILYEKAEEGWSLQFFCENIPWEKFLNDGKRTSKEIKEIKEKIIGLSISRILAIQDQFNFSSEIISWQSGSSGQSGYIKKIIEYFQNNDASSGLSGAKQESFLVAREKNENWPLSEEKNWLIPEYYLFFIFHFTKTFDVFAMAQPADEDSLTKFFEENIKKISDAIESKFGKEHFKQEEVKIKFAFELALARMISTLKIDSLDINGIKSEIWKMLNLGHNGYAAKISEMSSNTSKTIIRVFLEQVRHLVVHVDKFTQIVVNLKDKNGQEICENHDIDFASAKQNNKFLYNFYIEACKISMDRYDELVEWAVASRKKDSSIKEPTEYLKEEMKEIEVEIEKIKKEIPLFRNSTQIKQIKKSLIEEIKNNNLNIKVKEQKQEIVRKIIQIERSQESIEKIKKLINALEEVRLNSGLVGDDLDRAYIYASRKFAIESRYYILDVKRENRGIFSDDSLPLLIPKYKVDEQSGTAIISLEDAILSQIKPKHLNWSEITPNIFTQFATTMGQAEIMSSMIDVESNNFPFNQDVNKIVNEEVFKNTNRTWFEDWKQKVFFGTNALNAARLVSVWPMSMFQNKFSSFIEQSSVEMDRELRKKYSVMPIDIEAQARKGLGYLGLSSVTKDNRYLVDHLSGNNTPVGHATRLDLEFGLRMFSKSHMDFDTIMDSLEGKTSDEKVKILRSELSTSCMPEIREAIDMAAKEKNPKVAKATILGAMAEISVKAFLNHFSIKKTNTATRIGLITNYESYSKNIQTKNTKVKPLDAKERLYLLYTFDAMFHWIKTEYADYQSLPIKLPTLYDLVQWMIAENIIGPESFAIDLANSNNYSAEKSGVKKEVSK